MVGFRPGSQHGRQARRLSMASRYSVGALCPWGSDSHSEDQWRGARVRLFPRAFHTLACSCRALCSWRRGSAQSRVALRCTAGKVCPFPCTQPHTTTEGGKDIVERRASRGKRSWWFERDNSEKTQTFLDVLFMSWRIKDTEHKHVTSQGLRLDRIVS